MGTQRQQAAKARHERFAALVAKGISQVRAYRTVYPRSRAWKDKAVEAMACELARKVSVRIEAMRKAAVDKDVASAREILVALTNRMRRAQPGLAKVLTVLPDGTKTIEVTDQNADIISEATSRIDISGRGDGKAEACFVHVKVRDFADDARDIAKLAGYFPADRHELTGKNGAPLRVALDVNYVDERAVSDRPGEK